MSELKAHSYSTEFGFMDIAVSSKGLVSISFYEEKPEIEDPETDLHKKIYSQLKNYFDGNLNNFDIPLDLRGTDFQNKVWTALYNIPHGTTVSYKQIAEQIGHPKAYRAVGLANNKNPIPVVCACHRVVGSNGSLVGYAYGLDMKEKLINLESKI